jgi:hypothetical protein
MPSLFPGMDPYLENPEIFPDFYDSLITYLRENLQASLPAPYYAAIGHRVWIAASRRSIGPDVHVLRSRPRVQDPSEQAGTLAIATPRASRPVVVKVLHDEFREPFLEIYADSAEGKRLVTSVEILSLSNKTPGEQERELFLRKQKELLASRVNLVEIDLLRGGEHATAVPLDSALASCGGFDYHVCVHPFDDFESFFVYPIVLEEPLPAIDIPLLPGDSPVTLDLQTVFNRCYGAGPYAREIDYMQDTITPPLPADKADWAARLLQIRGS